MLKKRLIPKLQLKRMRVGDTHRSVLVTTVQFDEVVQVGDPVSQAKIYQDVAADELIFLDLDATAEGRPPDREAVASAARQIFMPITAGGGVRTLDDFRLLLKSGADKVSVNTAAIADPSLITEAARFFGAQCVTLSIDARPTGDGRWAVWGHGGRQPTGRDVVEWAREAEERGAGEILLTSIERDGTRTGLDLDLVGAVSRAVTVPMIASGGCGLAAHFTQGFVEGGADAVAAGTFFSLKDENPMQARAQIRNAGVPIRSHR